MSGEKQPQQKDFNKASDFDIPDWEKQIRVKKNIWFAAIEQLLQIAKDNAPENNGVSVNFSLEDVSGGIVYTPPTIRYSRGRSQQQQKKKANRDDIEAIVMENPDYLTLEETDTAYHIKTKKFLGDLWRPIMNKLNQYGAEWKPPKEGDKKCWVVPKQ